MRLIVSGSRSLNAPILVARYLSRLTPTGPHTLIHGACNTLDEEHRPILLRPGQPPGADRLAHFFALAHQWHVQAYPAQWSIHGNRAGPIRNHVMATQGGADRLLAFPGGAGTASMIAAARTHGIPITLAE